MQHHNAERVKSEVLTLRAEVVDMQKEWREKLHAHRQALLQQVEMLKRARALPPDFPLFSIWALDVRAQLDNLADLRYRILQESHDLRSRLDTAEANGPLPTARHVESGVGAAPRGKMGSAASTASPPAPSAAEKRRLELLATQQAGLSGVDVVFLVDGSGMLSSDSWPISATLDRQHASMAFASSWHDEGICRQCVGNAQG